MTLAYELATLRRGLAALWVVLMAWVGWFWLGLAGVGLTCVAATRWLRVLWHTPTRTLTLAPEAIKQVWVSAYAVAIVSREHPAPVWLFKDECPPARWASLLRFLYRHAPVQALGLSTSN